MKRGDKAERRKEIIINIALGNLGGLYQDLATWGEGREMKRGRNADMSQSRPQENSNININVPLTIINDMLYLR